MPSIRLMNQLTLGEYQALVTGIPKHCPNAIFTVAGRTFTAPEAVTFIGSVLATVTAVSAAKTAITDARMAEEASLSANGVAVKAIRENIALMFSNNTTTLAEFLITPKKPRAPLSIAARAAADAKAKATREARGTTSKKQKEQISGDVTGVLITPVKSGTAAAPATTSTSTGTASETPVAGGAGSTPAAGSASSATHP